MPRSQRRGRGSQPGGRTIADVYVDNDISAYSGKPRPEYLRMIEDIRAGKIDAVTAPNNKAMHWLWHLTVDERYTDAGQPPRKNPGVKLTRWYGYALGGHEIAALAASPADWHKRVNWWADVEVGRIVVDPMEGATPHARRNHMGDATSTF